MRIRWFAACAALAALAAPVLAQKAAAPSPSTSNPFASARSLHCSFPTYATMMAVRIG
jgi:hypothetical protein